MKITYLVNILKPFLTFPLYGPCSGATYYHLVHCGPFVRLSYKSVHVDAEHEQLHSKIYLLWLFNILKGSTSTLKPLCAHVHVHEKLLSLLARNNTSIFSNKNENKYIDTRQKLYISKALLCNW